MRPSNSATVVQHDLVGQTVGADLWPLAVLTLETGEVTRGEMLLEPGDEPVRLHCIPVRCEGTTVAVLARLSAGAGRRPGHLERTYRDLFDRFAVMLSESTFPFPSEEVATEEAPRVGDGVVLVDEEGRVRYASPNATNALHRMGMYSQIEGRRLTDLGIEESAIEWALASALPGGRGGGAATRRDRAAPLHPPDGRRGDVTGCLVLLRDVTDVRRLDRLLLSKDAAIREVHHRVKNNLQTISALLRLQARRLPPGGGRVALFEAERRVRSIAIVHEILSRDPSDQVPFDEIVTSLIRMAEDSVVLSRPLTFEVIGGARRGAGRRGHTAGRGAGRAPPERRRARLPRRRTATDGRRPATWSARRSTRGPAQPVGHIRVHLVNDLTSLTLEVIDDGSGLPEGFDIDATQSLGLSIVRDLVRSQLDGTITMRNRQRRPARGSRGPWWPSSCRSARPHPVGL